MITNDGDDFADVRRLLDKVPAPTVAVVDAGAVYAAALDREVRSARRWRRVAVSGAFVAAAVMLAAVLPKMDVRVGGSELVVRWGDPAPVPPAPVPAPPPAPATPDPAILARLDALDDRSRALADQDAKLRELRDLILTVAADVDERDNRRRDQLAAVLRQLRVFEASTRAQIRQAEETSTALYTAVFDRTRPSGGAP